MLENNFMFYVLSLWQVSRIGNPNKFRKELQIEFELEMLNDHIIQMWDWIEYFSQYNFRLFEIKWIEFFSEIDLIEPT